MVVRNSEPSRSHENAEREFEFDKVFDSTASTAEVFDGICKPLVDHVFDGFNACSFAYGQTGSGKTYTIFGKPDEADAAGILPRALEYAFELASQRPASGKTCHLYVSFLESYMDQLRDLGKAFAIEAGVESTISKGGAARGIGAARPSSAKQQSPVRPTSAKAGGAGGAFRPASAGPRGMVAHSSDGALVELPSLEIHEAADKSVYVKDLTVIPVSSVKQAMDIVRAGVAKRATFETVLNEVSSRSHTVFTLTVVQTDNRAARSGEAPAITGMLNIVDLAGSERVERSLSVGQRFKEAVNINKSLSALGTVVMALSSGDYSYIPYRDSKLTRLLQESLGGNSYTTLIATVTIASADFDESLNTLHFANRCQNVNNQPHINYVDSGDENEKNVIIMKLMAEIAELQQRLQASGLGGLGGPADAVPLGGQRPKRISVIDPATGQLVWVDAAAAKTPLAGIVTSLMGSMGSRGSMSGGATGMDGMEPASFHGGAAVAGEIMHAQQVQQLKSSVEAVQKKSAEESMKKDAELQLLRQQVTSLKDEVDATKMQAETSVAAQKTQFTEERKRLVGNNQDLLHQMNQLLMSTPDSLRVDSARLASAKRDASSVVERKHSEYLSQMKDAEASFKAQLAAAKDAAEVRHGRTAAELKRVLAELADCKSAQSAEAERLTGQLLTVYDAHQRLERVLHNIDGGVYPIGDKSGSTTVLVPRAHRPPALPDAIAKTVSRAKTDPAFHALLQQQAEAAAKAAAPAEAEAEGALHDNPSRLNRMAPRPATGGSHASKSVPRIAATSALADGRGRPASAASAAPLLRAELGEELLAELSAHSTVEYIRTLEAERDRYRSQLQESAKRNKELQVMLDARQRQLDKRASENGFNGRVQAQRPMSAYTSVTTPLNYSRYPQYPAFSRTSSAASGAVTDFSK